MKGSIALAAVLTSLVVAPGVTAKGLESVRVCGVSECRTVGHNHLSLDFFPSGSFTARPHDPGEWFQGWLRFRPERFVLRVRVLPERGLLEVSGDDGLDGWHQISTASVEVWRRATRGIEPLPAGTLGDGYHEARRAATATAGVGVDEGGGLPWPWIAGIAAALGLLGHQLRSARRRAPRAGG